jgi:hypothetical protein
MGTRSGKEELPYHQENGGGVEAPRVALSFHWQRNEDVMLPENMYASIVLNFIATGHIHTRDHKFITLLVFTVAAQCYMVSHLMAFSQIMENESAAACFQGDRDVILRNICLALFLMAVWQEIRSTIDLFNFLHHIPASQDGHSHSLKLWQLANGNTVVDRNSGITLTSRIIIYISTVIPQILLAGVVSHYGTKFIMIAESNEDAIMNCLAMIFILQVDELVYKISDTPTRRLRYKQVQETPITETHTCANRLSRFVLMIIPLLISGYVTLMDFYFCEAVWWEDLILITFGLVQTTLDGKDHLRDCCRGASPERAATSVGAINV